MAQWDVQVLDCDGAEFALFTYPRNPFFYLHNMIEWASREFNGETFTAVCSCPSRGTRYTFSGHVVGGEYRQISFKKEVPAQHRRTGRRSSSEFEAMQ